MDRKSRQTVALLVLSIVLGLASLVGFVGGIAFELGRWMMRTDDLDNPTFDNSWLDDLVEKVV